MPSETVLPETCDECESTGSNCPMHDGPEWREDEADDDRQE